MWQVKENSLYRAFRFKDFTEALSFMNVVGAEAEKMQHHPIWTNEYNKVEIWLTTHDAGNTITDKDRQLSDAIDNIYKSKYADSEKVTD